jgi:hypothetical protein
MLDAITHEAITVTSQYEDFHRQETGWSGLLYKLSQRIRECIDAALVLYQNDDDGLEARLREGGETMLCGQLFKRP